MRIGVSALNLETMRHAARNLGLQSVIDGVANRTNVERLEQRVVCDRVEGQYTVFGSEEQIGLADPGRSATERVGRIATESNQLIHQRRIGRIAVYLPVDVSTLSADVVHIKKNIARNLALDSEVQLLAELSQ